jgi:hypothetical protein
MASLNTVDSHEPRHSMLAASLAGFSKIEENTRRAIDAMARDERGADQSKQSRILLSAIRHRLIQPSVVPTSGHPEQSTHHVDAVLAAVILDELVDPADVARTLSLGHCLPPPHLAGMLRPVHQILGTPDRVG